MSADPAFATDPKIDIAQVSTANTNRDGTTGTYATVAAGTTNGKLIDRVTIVAAGTTTAGVIRLFIDNGTNVRLWKEILVAAITPSATVAVFTHVLNNLGLVLPNGYNLIASTHNAETFNIIAEGAAV